MPPRAHNISAYHRPHRRSCDNIALPAGKQNTCSTSETSPVGQAPDALTFGPQVDHCPAFPRFSWNDPLVLAWYGMSDSRCGTMGSRWYSVSHGAAPEIAVRAFLVDGKAEVVMMIRYGGDARSMV